VDNKWWEYYVVRYLVGTVVGAILVLVLIDTPGSPFSTYASKIGAYKDQPFLGVGLVAALGFAFCYLASSPVLTLHATRAHLRAIAISANAWSPYAFAAALLLPSILAAWWLSDSLPLLAAMTAGPAIGIPSGLVLLAAFSKFVAVERFARDLAKRRAAAYPAKEATTSFGQEYVTSYRHLREHGNAFLILVLEGVLANALLRAPSVAFAVGVVALWVLPAAAVWVVGTVLESRFAANDKV